MFSCHIEYICVDWTELNKTPKRKVRIELKETAVCEYRRTWQCQRRRQGNLTPLLTFAANR